MNFCELEM